MKFFSRKWISAAAFLLAATMVPGGCGKGPDANKEDKTLIVWHWMTDRDDTFQDLCSQYKGQTGVDVRFELYAPSDVYTQKVRAAAQTNTLPDVYGILGESRDISKFVKAGYVFELTPYFDENAGAWRNVFFPKALETNEFKEGNTFGIKPGIYGVPIDVTNLQILYNKNIFTKSGLDPENPPKTWDEFIQACQKIKDTGYAVFVSGFGEIWLINSLATCFAINIMGYEKFENTIKGDVPYNDPDWIKVYALFDELSKKGFLMSGIVSMVNKQAERNFALEEAAFAYNGSWCVNVYTGMNPQLSYATMLPPKVNPNGLVMIQGGAGSSFFINSRSEKKDMAIAFLKWLTDKRQQLILSQQTHNLPSNKDTFGADTEKILLEFVDDMDKMFHPNTIKYSEHPRVLEKMGSGIQGIIIGEKTPEEVGEEIQTMKKSLM
jgi:ABC-type glycerol-3-phosphate transport system substrate-binding protein